MHGPLRAQDTNVHLPPDSLEHLLARAPFEPPDRLVGTRFADDRTSRAELVYEDGSVILAKWAPAPGGGEAFNNNPRYEVAAYQLQKLFLEPDEYVVPPTVVRSVSLSWYRERRRDVTATFGVAESVLCVHQYFLYRVTAENVFDAERFDADPAYARHWANANLLTFLIWHSDSNEGNLLVSTDPRNPRVFAVDNGLAFRSPPSDRGTRWRVLQVRRFPAETVERLRALTRRDLVRELGVLAQFEVVDGELVRTEPAEKWRPRRGVRVRDDGVQLGLTEAEIDDVRGRIEGFLRSVDEGRMETF